jgi:Tfp pilus assembly protein PilO
MGEVNGGKEETMTPRATIILLIIMVILSCAGMLWSLFERIDEAIPYRTYHECMLSQSYNRTMTIDHLAALQAMCKEQEEGLELILRQEGR